MSAIEGRCPNCGADQPVGDVVECPYCRALVNSGEHGRVLAEITQASEWRPGSAGAAIDGLAGMQAVDPWFNRQQIEDRAYVRIRWSAAYARGAPPTPQTNVLVLVRVAGVQTRIGLSSDRCRNCGAPVVTATDSPNCDHCGAGLAAGMQEFVLDEIASPTAVVHPARPAGHP